MSRFVSQPIPYSAANDYGSRDHWPTLAVVWHMAEGRDVAQYLSRRPLRSVSVHYTIEQGTDRWRDGEVVRCLPEDRISGSINPRAIRRGDDPDGYYGASHAKAALGSHWLRTSPNCVVISVEVAGRASQAPNEAHQRSMVALWDELRAHYSRAMPLAHRDWQDVKPCPGRTAAMKAAFAAMGGHGTSYREVRAVSTRDYVSGRVCTVRDGSKLFDYPGGLPIGTVDAPLDRDHLGTDRSGDYVLVASVLDSKPRTAWVRAKAVSKVRPAPAPTPDCAAAVAAERERIATAVLARDQGLSRGSLPPVHNPAGARAHRELPGRGHPRHRRALPGPERRRPRDPRPRPAHPRRGRHPRRRVRAGYRRAPGGRRGRGDGS